MPHNGAGATDCHEGTTAVRPALADPPCVCLIDRTYDAARLALCHIRPRIGLSASAEDAASCDADIRQMN